jgi:nitrite reductase/ring-hydroxylating ferredoxin subunit
MNILRAGRHVGVAKSLSEDADPIAGRPQTDVAWTRIPIAMPPEGQTGTFSVGELQLLLCNAGGTPYVVHDECPHVKTSMKGGLIRGTLLECPLHGGLMDLRDGSPAGMPIRRPGRCFAVRAEGEEWLVGIAE